MQENMTFEVIQAIVKVSEMTGAPLDNDFTLDVSKFSKMEIVDIEVSLRHHIDEVAGEREEWLIDYCPDDKTITIELDPDEKETSDEKDMNRKAGLSMPIGLFHQKLVDGKYAKKVDLDASIYLTAVLEYLTAEIMELAGNECRDAKRTRIIPRHIQKAISGDEELNKLLGGLVVSGITIPLKKEKSEQNVEEEKGLVEESQDEENDCESASVEENDQSQDEKDERTIYLLFDCKQFGNSDDPAYELDYAFIGTYLTEKDALMDFAHIMIERGEDANKYHPKGKDNVQVIKKMLEKENWKIMKSGLSI